MLRQCTPTNGSGATCGSLAFGSFIYYCTRDGTRDVFNKFTNPRTKTIPLAANTSNI